MVSAAGRAGRRLDDAQVAVQLAVALCDRVAIGGVQLRGRDVIAL